MNRPIRMLPEARAEYDDAVDWYAEQRVALGKDFIAKIRQTLKQVFERPHMFPKVHGDVRKARVKTYPYAVFFRETADEIVVIAIFHSSRDPDLLRKRFMP